MRNNRFDESYSSENQDSSSQNMHSGSSNNRIRNQSGRQQLISLNVRLFNGLGFNVNGNNFRYQSSSEEQSESQNENESDSDHDERDYGEESQQVMEDDLEEQQPSDQEHSHQRSSDHSEEMLDESDQNQSPFFSQPSEQEGMSKPQINSLPTMNWSQAHNLFNGGQQCPVCLQEFKIGNTLRVLECLHRYHVVCLDEWLGLKGNCPICRNSFNNRQGQNI